MDKTLNPCSLNFSLLKIEFAVQRFATNCFLEPGWHVKDTDGQTIKELAGKGPACSFPFVSFVVRRRMLLLRIYRNDWLPFVPLTLFESLRVPAFLHLMQFCRRRSSSPQVASLPVKFVVGKLFACHARSSYRQPYRQFLFDSRYGNGRGAIFSTIETFVELAWSAVAPMENGVTYSLAGQESNVVQEECKYRLAGWWIVIYANAQNQYRIRVIGRVRSRLLGNYS